MAGIEFGVRATPENVREHVSSYLQEQGYKVTPVANGHLKAEIGSLKKTMLLGAMAGKNFHRSFIIGINPSGELTAVSVNRDTAGSALKGGAIGASKAQGYFDEFAGALRQHFGQALVGERAI